MTKKRQLVEALNNMPRDIFPLGSEGDRHMHEAWMSIIKAYNILVEQEKEEEQS